VRPPRNRRRRNFFLGEKDDFNNHDVGRGAIIHHTQNIQNSKKQKPLLSPLPPYKPLHSHTHTSSPRYSSVTVILGGLSYRPMITVAKIFTRKQTQNSKKAERRKEEGR